jgi:hypothetical protein
LSSWPVVVYHHSRRSFFQLRDNQNASVGQGDRSVLSGQEITAEKTRTKFSTHLDFFFPAMTKSHSSQILFIICPGAEKPQIFFPI